MLRPPIIFLNINKGILNTAYGLSKMYLFGFYAHNVSLKIVGIKIPFIFNYLLLFSYPWMVIRTTVTLTMEI